MVLPDLEELFDKLNTREDALDLVLKVLKESDSTVDDVFRGLFILGEYKGEEAKEIKKKLKYNNSNEEVYNGERVHVTRIGGDQIRLSSLEREEKFLKAVGTSDIEYAIMLSILHLESANKAEEKSFKKIPYGLQAVYGICE